MQNNGARGQPAKTCSDHSEPAHAQPLTVVASPGIVWDVPAGVLGGRELEVTSLGRNMLWCLEREIH